MKKASFCFEKILSALFIVSLAAAGLFYDYIACIFSAVLCMLFLVYLAREKQLVLHTGITFWAILAITGFYGVSVLWALDPGLAFIGFLKFLPVLLFLILLQQLPDAKAQILSLFPGCMAAMVIVSTLGSLIPALAEYLLVADRLAGFLQYPNTFALLLLLGELWILAKEHRKIIDWVILVVLLFGILYSGSRTVFVLAILSNLALAFTPAGKKLRIPILCAMLGGVILVVVGALLLDSAILNRFLRFSFLESTFAGRLLYWQDALPVILTHPFGLGHQGYYYIQQSIQSGIYSTMYTHNELLQLMLDIGWLPVILLIIAIINAFRNPSLPVSQKILLGTLLSHCLFDFDLQFVSVFFLLVLLLDFQNGKERKLQCSKALSIVAAGVGLVSIYMGIALLLPHTGQVSAARAMCPWNTPLNTAALAQETDPVKGKLLADKILAQNSYVNLAYSMQAEYAYGQGDFGTLIQIKTEILERFPFQYEEYVDYCQKLIVGIDLYETNGDPTSADYCRQALLQAKAALEALTDRVSPLGRIIVDQPVTTLPEEIVSYIDQIQ